MKVLVALSLLFFVSFSHSASLSDELAKVREIASASNEQSTGVRGVTKAIQQLDQTTHQNTSIAQESSAMAKKLKNQADHLNEAVNELISVSQGGVAPKAIFTYEESSSDSKILSLPRRDQPSKQQNTGLKVSGLDTECGINS